MDKLGEFFINIQPTIIILIICIFLCITISKINKTNAVDKTEKIVLISNVESGEKKELTKLQNVGFTIIEDEQKIKRILNIVEENGNDQ